MRITLVVVGKTADARIQSLIEDYRQRLTHYVPFEFVVIPDIKNAKSLPRGKRSYAVLHQRWR